MDAAFIKTAPAADLAMFEAEAAGLEELRRAGEIRVPEVLGVGLRDGRSFIELERMVFSGSSAATEERLGRQLARLHGHTQKEFGWYRDNTIGPTPQKNAVCDDWLTFFRERRLAFQLDLAARHGHAGELQDLGARLLDALPALFEDYRPAASLVHGDLWGGNWGAVDGEPVVFDPAVYFGDRETDIAMTMLFGGFSKTFYRAYSDAWPLAAGSETRLRLYQLYHVLNHLNLFGSGYHGQALRLLRSLV
jgi:fructosamine-3-kinase